ncbi:MAG TPA: NRDE family protein [Alphaproteobacteria bacterium]
MCTLVILRRSGDSWPLILAANRDEVLARPWAPPARHWPERPHVVAGRDLEAGGTWLGLGDGGVAAGVLNRPGALGPAPGKASRGELVLRALDHDSAAAAVRALRRLDATQFRPFNLVVADAGGAWWLRWAGAAGGIEAAPVPEGLSMITAHDLNDTASARIRRQLPRFRAAPEPDPALGDWSAWQRLLADSDGGADGPHSAMTLGPASGFGTVSSSLIALPARAGTAERARWLFAPGRPDTTEFEPVDLSPNQMLEGKYSSGR